MNLKQWLWLWLYLIKYLLNIKLFKKKKKKMIIFFNDLGIIKFKCWTSNSYEDKISVFHKPDRYSSTYNFKHMMYHRYTLLLKQDISGKSIDLYKNNKLFLIKRFSEKLQCN